MKKVIITTLLISLVLLLESCGFGMHNFRSHLLRLQAGMSQAEVVSIVGEPHNRAFDGALEEWTYVHNDLLSQEYWSLIFDRGILRSMSQRRPEVRRIEGYPSEQREPVYPPTYGEGYAGSEWFERLYAEVRRAPFESDKLRLIADASRGGVFSTQQTVALMKIFSFDGERLKVLRILAPRTILRGDAYEIINSFTFEKDAARRILDESIRRRDRRGYGQGYDYPRKQDNAEWFSRVLNQVRRAPFESDKLGVISDACRGGVFTATQAVALMKVFPFDSERLKVLRIVAPHLLLRGDAYEIINSFTFEKDVARSILDQAVRTRSR